MADGNVGSMGGVTDRDLATSGVSFGATGKPGRNGSAGVGTGFATEFATDRPLL